MDILIIPILLLISLIGFSSYNITNATNEHKKKIEKFNLICGGIFLIIAILACMDLVIVKNDKKKYKMRGDSLIFDALYYTDTYKGYHHFCGNFGPNSLLGNPSDKVSKNIKLPLITKSRLNTKVRIYYLNGNAVKICPNFTEWNIIISLIDFFVLYVFNFINFFIVLGKKIDANSDEE